MAADFVQRGRTCVEQGQLQEAVRICRLGLLANPGEMEGRLILGSALIALSRFDEVLGEMKSALDMEPTNASALTLKGEALLRKGDWQQAMTALDQAASVAPGDPYVEDLRQQVAQALAESPVGNQTVDIDPEVEGVQIEEVRPLTPVETLGDDDIELLDDDLLEEVNTPAPTKVGGAIHPDAGQEPTVAGFRAAPPQADPPTKVIQKNSAAPIAEPASEAPMHLDSGPAPLPTPFGRPVPQSAQAAPVQPSRPQPSLPQPAVQENRDDPFDEPTYIPSEEVLQSVIAESRNHRDERASSIDEGVDQLFSDRVEMREQDRAPSINSLFPEEKAEIQDEEWEWSDPEDAINPASNARPATIGSLFPDDEEDESERLTADLGALRPPSAESGQAKLSNTGDMALIREGLGAVSGETKSVPASSDIFSRPPTVESRERPRVDISPEEEEKAFGKVSKKPFKVPAWGWALGVLVMAGGGAYGGLQLRNWRVAGQVAKAKENARELLRKDDIWAYRKARVLYKRVADASGALADRAALAKIEAILSFEFGANSTKAQEEVSKLKASNLTESLAARAYLALAQGNDAEAARTAKALVDAENSSAEGHYLLGRVSVSAGDAEAAVTHLKKSLDLESRPLAWVALGQAELLRGQFEEAQAAARRALELSAGHPAASILSARVSLQSGDLSSASEPDATLEALVQRSRLDTKDANSISPAQGAWAGLVLAEVKLNRGDRSAAKKALAEAKIGRPDNWFFSEMLSDLLVRLGDKAGARQEAERARKAWPQRSKAQNTLAYVALLEGNAARALDILADVSDIEKSAESLILRGRAQLSIGKVREASADLDAALQIRPKALDGLITRSKIDLLQGDPKSAISRLAPVFDSTAKPELIVAYAAALRASGKQEEARKALASIADEQQLGEVLVERAQLEELDGRYEAAEALYQKALESSGSLIDAQLGAALLEAKRGRLLVARDQLERLTDKEGADGRVLVETARVQTLTGHSAKAQKLLDAVGESSPWLGWQVARERGRILLRKQTPIEAISELQRAQSLRPEDAETRLLLMRAHLEVRNKRGSGRSLQGITKAFKDSPIRPLAVGIHALVSEKGSDAIAAFSEARNLLIERKAPPFELARAAYWMGRAFEFEGDLAQALKWLNKATEQNPSHADAYFWIGQIQHQNEKPGKMAVAYEKSVEIDPSSNALAWYFLGIHYSENGVKNKAISSLENFLRYYPEDGGDVVAEAKTLLGQIR